MANGKNPLMLMMALSMPGAAQALGLGDIHVDSALNERLVAEIDLIGATPSDLTDLRAAVASRETFLHLGADRPAFVSSATFKIAEDKRGRPVLAVSSTDAFTEPLVNFVVDLRWRNGQIMRQYTLLLDPPGFAAPLTAPSTAAPPVAAPRVAAPVTAPSAAAHPAVAPSAAALPAATPGTAARPQSVARKTTHIKVGAKATLRGIAWRVGERSPSDLQRMMIAIFRANPGAFDGNINRLHLGAVLIIPSSVDVASISPEEAKQVVRAQMAAWHALDSNMHARSSSPIATPVAAAAAAPYTGELDRRVSSLEHELVEMQGLLESERGKLAGMEQQVARAGKAAVQAPVVDAPVAPAPTMPQSAHAPLVPILGGLGLLAGALAALYLRLRRRAPQPENLPVEAPAAPAAAVENDVRDDSHGVAAVPAHSGAREIVAPDTDSDTDTETDTNPRVPVPAVLARPKRVNNAAATISLPAADQAAERSADTVRLPMDAQAELSRVDATHVDYDLLDLDMTAQHVQMPSVLNEGAVMKERRTNLADVLKLAIEREPDRHDLRMKLLELYYSAAATNRKAFLEVVQKFAHDRDYLNTDQWDKIAYMGRQIASDSPLFAEESASDDDLANCA